MIQFNVNINNYDLLYCVKLQLKCMLILYQATTSMMTASQISFFSFSSTPTEIHLEVALLFLNIAYVLLKKAHSYPFLCFPFLKKPLTKNTLWQENLVPRFISYVRMKGRSNTGNIKINLSHLQYSCLEYHNCVYFLCILSKFLNNFIYLCYNGSMINRVHVLFNSFHSNFQSG